MKNFFKSEQNIYKLIATCILIVIAIAVAITLGIKIKEESNKMVPNYFAEKETVKIDCFGDSITYSSNGMTLVQCSKTYPGELSEKLLELFDSNAKSFKVNNIEVNNLGIPGDWIVDESYKRLSGEADIIVMLYGINNVFQNRPYEGIIETNIEEIIKSGAKLYLMLYPECPGCSYKDLVTITNEHIKKVATNMDVNLINPNIKLSKIKDVKSLFQDDGIHLTSEGYELLAKIVADHIYQDYRK